MDRKGGPLDNCFTGSPKLRSTPEKATPSPQSVGEHSLLKDITPLSPPSKWREGKEV